MIVLKVITDYRGAMLKSQESDSLIARLEKMNTKIRREPRKAAGAQSTSAVLSTPW